MANGSARPRIPSRLTASSVNSLGFGAPRSSPPTRIDPGDHHSFQFYFRRRTAAAPGAQVKCFQEGTNQYHGSGFLSSIRIELDAFKQVPTRRTWGALSCDPTTPPVLATSLGGPIYKEKLFFSFLTRAPQQ